MIISFTTAVAYKIFDTDGKGYITRQEFYTVLNLVFEISDLMGLSRSNISQYIYILISAFEKSQLGFITQDEFYKIASTSPLVKGIIGL